MYFYFYQVKYWDEIDKKEKEDSGFVPADVFSEAITRVSNYYGEDYIQGIKINIASEENDDLLTLDALKDAIKTFSLTF